ncbi:holo-ACP synthase [Filifactor alocis]|nr:holo-ACP synthase [Filifactor alocis]
MLDKIIGIIFFRQEKILHSNDLKNANLVKRGINMVKGVGVDIVSIKRMSNLCSKHPRTIDRLFTEKEKYYFKQKNNSIETIASFFAVKESVAKALGTGFVGFSMKDIEIFHDSYGKPYVTLYSNARMALEEKEISYVHISISHERDNAIAFCVME